MSRVVGSALLNHKADECWSMTCIEYPKGLALLEPRPTMTRVIVADSTNTFAGPADPDAYSAAACTRDGEMALVVRNSPPALVIGSTGCRTLPAAGASRECVRLVPGERLLLLSCAAFESMPEVLANGIANVPAHLAGQDPDDLLLEIFHELGHGAGAVIDRLPVPTPQGASS